MERVWNGGDLAAVDEFVAPRYTIHSDPGDPWDGQELDLEAFKSRMVTSRAPFPDLEFTLGELLEDGDRVAVSWRVQGTQAGAIGEHAASGKRIDAQGMTIYYFAEGKITGHRQVVDRLTVMQQLGMLG